MYAPHRIGSPLRKTWWPGPSPLLVCRPAHLRSTPSHAAACDCCGAMRSRPLSPCMPVAACCYALGRPLGLHARRRSRPPLHLGFFFQYHVHIVSLVLPHVHPCHFCHLTAALTDSTAPLLPSPAVVQNCRTPVQSCYGHVGLPARWPDMVREATGRAPVVLLALIALRLILSYVGGSVPPRRQ
jgi:hypothetical protein